MPVVMNLSHVRGASRRGTVLLTATIVAGMLLAFVLSALAIVSGKCSEAHAAEASLQADMIAEAGVQNAMYHLREAMRIWGTFTPIDALDPDEDDDIYGGATQIIFANGGGLPGTLADAGGAPVGQYDVFLDVRDRGNATSRTILLRSQGFLPTKAAFSAGQRGSATSEVTARVSLRQIDGRPGNYAYFINHWGWLYGSAITINGTPRANGKFALRHNPTINGSPVYESAVGSELFNKVNDGGIVAGLNIEGTCLGMANLEENRYEYEAPTAMPNLSNLAWYRNYATSTGGSLSIGGSELTGNGVYGDAAGEKDHLYLEGTALDPIHIEGTVVVNGDLIIKGHVTGKGTIIAGRNIYVAGNINYLNGPATPRPASNDKADIESWLAGNLDKDFVGLYARKHIVVGDWTDGTWQSNVFSWLSDANNRTDEDAGLDQIHGSGDIYENDGQWTVERYTAEHAMLGLIPTGSAVGDIIPGTGEDIDGDGVKDPQLTTNAQWIAEFQTSTAVDPATWGGNLPAPADRTFSTFASGNIWNLDGCFFTNHAFAGLIRGGTETVRFNGALIARNESIVFSPRLEINHDARLTGRSWEDMGLIGGGGKVWSDIALAAWWKTERGSR